MTVLRDRNGTWINQFALPPEQAFKARAKQTSYVVIKFGLRRYEEFARAAGVPWVAERMGESGVGSQDGPSHALLYAQQLADQANQPGCVAAVINLEEADGGWHHDDGNATRLLVNTFRSKASGLPLFASLDTRGNRPNSPYQRVCAELCDGVMPMVYHGAFQQSAPVAFATAITPLVRTRWAGKEIIPTYQTYSMPQGSRVQTDVPAQLAQVQALYDQGVIVGANSYTLGHATESQWRESLAFKPHAVQTVPLPPDVAAALAAIRKAWIDGWHAIEQRGTVQEAVAYADFWRRLVGA